MSFKRAPHINTLSPVRSSDRRKLCQQVVQEFGVDAELAKVLVPDGILTAKVTTHLDLPGTVYFSPNSAGTNPLWFSLGKPTPSATLLLIPTIYTLTAYPTLLPTISTHPHVIHRLISGADLLAPGLAGPPSNLDMKEGDLIAILATGCDTPLGVGRLTVDARELREVRGKRGKAVGLLHCWNDHLWTAGKTPVKISFSLPDSDSEEEESDEEESPQPQPDLSSAVKNLKVIDLSKDESPVASTSTSASPELSPKDIDVILRLALLQYINSFPSPPAQVPAGIFPISSSTFIETILSLRPHWAPAEAVIAKSSFKKAGKWLKAMEKEGLIKIKSTRDQDLIASVDTSNVALKDFKPHGTTGEAEAREKKRAAAAGGGGGGGAGSSSSGPGGAGDGGGDLKGKGRRIEVVELWKPHGNTTAFWSAVDLQGPDDSEPYYTTSQIRTHLLAYLQAHNLAHPRDKSFILLDDALKTAILKKGEKVEFVKRDDAVERLRNGMQSFYSIRVEGEKEVRKKGSPTPIHITAKKRQSKFVTLVTGLELFGVDPKTFSEELKRVCASATVVSPINTTSKTSLMEVLVQGTHDKVVTSLLVERGVPKKWIQFVKGK